MIWHHTERLLQSSSRDPQKPGTETDLHDMKERIQKLIEVEPDCEFCGPASPESISQVKERLGVALPADFRAFLQ